MSDVKANSKQDFWGEATKLAPGSNMAQLRYDLTSLWLLACDIRSRAAKVKSRGLKSTARRIERLAFRWKELSKTLQADERLKLRGSLAACWGHLCYLCYAQCRAFHHQPKCMTSLHGCPILAVSKTALGLPINERYSDGTTYDEYRQSLCASQKCALCGDGEKCKLWGVFGDCEGAWDACSGRLYDYIRKEAISK